MATNERQRGKGGEPLRPILPLSKPCMIIIQNSKKYAREYGSGVAMSSHLLLALLKDGDVAETLLRNEIDPNKSISLLLQTPGALFAIAPDLNGDGLTNGVHESIRRAALLAKKQGFEKVTPIHLLQRITGFGASALAHAYLGDLDKIQNLKPTREQDQENSDTISSKTP